MDRYDSIIRNYGKDGFEKIQNAKVLVVGGGGIGCEILKNLALTGFKTIELIDLDTIDVSNLNRQFLFRPEHVGQSKALIAGKAATSFNPDMKVISHHDNIKNTKFNLSYFEKFDLVLNALDNIEARRHVNRLCLSANVPLIDSGTTGYLGQVMPILKNKTSCYECFPKPTQKVYPICTIRSTPDKPVHCIVWAKECFKLLFNQPSESMLYEDVSTGETSTYMHLIKFPGEVNTTSSNIDMILEYGKKLLIALYHTEIQKRLDMDVYKTAKITPVPLDITAITTAFEECKQLLDNIHNITTAGWDYRLFTLHENLLQFFLCLCDIYQSDESKGLIGKLSFDKDDIWAMKFVTVASNLRSYVFSIPLLPFHDAKGIAGNIIPAIATTNAIVAGVQVLQAVRLLTQPTALKAAEDENPEQHHRRIQLLCPHTYCLRLPTRRGLFLQPCQAEAPLPACYVCGGSEITLQIDVNTSTLGEVVTLVLKGKLGFNEPNVMMGSNCLYEEGDGADEDLQDNLCKKLAQCPAGGVQDGALLAIEDFTQNLEVRLIVKHVSQEVLAAIPSAAEDMFIIGGQGAFEKLQQLQQEKEKGLGSAKQGSVPASSALEEDDGFAVLDDVEVVLSTSAPATANGSGTTKKRDIADICEENNGDITSSTAKKQREG